MSISVLVHIANEEAFAAELDEFPESSAQSVVIRNPRRRDGKDLHYLDEEVSTIIVPWHRINFIEVLPASGGEEVIGFVRE
jgi:hypothetical protein